MKREGCPRRNELFLVFVLTLSIYVSCTVMSSAACCPRAAHNSVFYSAWYVVVSCAVSICQRQFPSSLSGRSVTRGVLSPARLVPTVHRGALDSTLGTARLLFVG